MENEILGVSDRLLSAVTNGMYQGILITALVALSFRLFRRINAATRHAVWLCTLVLLVLLVVAHCFFQSGPLAFQPGKIVQAAATPEQEMGPSNAAAVAATDKGLPTEIGPSGPKWPADLSSEQEPLGSQEPDTLSWAPTELPYEAQEFSVGSSPPPGVTLRGGEPNSPSIEVEPLTASTAYDQSAGFYNAIRRLANPVSLTLGLKSRAARIAGATLLGVCLVLSAVRFFMLLLRLHQIRRIKQQSFPASEALNEFFRGLVARFGAGRKVELKTWPTSPSSFVLGFLHPVILLPAEPMELTEAEQILRHELAHVRRRDDWANLLQHFIFAAFAFHPAVWWISKRLALEREIACDDYVLQSSAAPHAYALLLANLAARMQRGPPLLAPGASNNKTQLQQRIDMILNTRRNTSPRLAASWFTFMASTAALLAVTAVCLAPRIVLAQSDSAPAAANAQGAFIDDPVPGAPAVAFVAVSGSPEAGEAVAGDAAPSATPGPASIGPGPKLKPGRSIALNSQPAVAPVAPAPAVPVAPSTLPAPPIPRMPQGSIMLSAVPAPEPKPDRAPRPARAESGDSSLEERLERLEKMVESLMTRGDATQKPYHLKQPDNTGAPRPYHLKLPDDRLGPLDRKEIAEIGAQARHQAEIAQKQGLDVKQIERIKEQAKHEAARAGQFNRAAVDAEKSAREQKRQTVNLNQLLTDYAELTGRTVLRPNSLPNPQISLNTPLPSTKREAIEAIESTLASNGIAIIQVGEKFIKAVPTTQALQESANRRVFKEGSQKQLDELRKRLENLEREREKLEHQIEELERQQEQLDQQGNEEQDSNAQSDTSEFNSDSPPRQ